MILEEGETKEVQSAFIEQQSNFELYNICKNCPRCVLVTAGHIFFLSLRQLFSFLIFDTRNPKRSRMSDVRLAGKSAISQTFPRQFRCPPLLLYCTKSEQSASFERHACNCTSHFPLLYCGSKDLPRRSFESVICPRWHWDTLSPRYREIHDTVTSLLFIYFFTFLCSICEACYTSDLNSTSSLYVQGYTVVLQLPSAHHAGPHAYVNTWASLCANSDMHRCLVKVASLSVLMPDRTWVEVDAALVHQPVLCSRPVWHVNCGSREGPA